MAPTDVAIWTEHETKTIESVSTPCTMVMYRTVSNKYITGLYVPSLLLKQGSNFPAWDPAYQSIGNGFLAGPVMVSSNWQVKGTLQNTNDPTTNRLLLAGTTSQAVSYSGSISSTNYKSTFANFVDTTFSIGPGLQVANITGELHGSVATDKLAQMTPNNFSTIVNQKLYNPADLSDTVFNDQTTSFEKSWIGTTVINPNTFYANKPNPDNVTVVLPVFIFNTTKWGTGTGNGITLQDIGVFQNTQCMGVNIGKKQDLSTLSWIDEGSSTSKYIPEVTGGENADIYMPTTTTVDGGYTVGQPASVYIRLNNEVLGNANDKVVKGTYIFKLNLSAPWNFTLGSYTVDRDFTLNNMGLNFTGSYQNPGIANEDLGAKISIGWNVTGLNTVYALTNATDLSSNSITRLAYTENIVRVRIDSNSPDTRSQDVLYLGDGIANAISILPEKLWNDGSSIVVTDQYGLWYNARYNYYISAYNVVTGEAIVNQERQVTTGPATPINWQEAQVTYATGNPSIYMEWENPLATGTAVALTYTVSRLAYGGTGVDVSGNIERSFSNFLGIIFPVLTTRTYSTTTDETLLYGKTFSYTLKANATGNSNTLTQSYTVPDESGGNGVLDWQLDASQNEVATILQSRDYQNQGLTYQNNYVVITVPTDYTFSDGSSPTEYQIFEQYKLIATIPKAKVDASGNKIIFTKYWLNGNNTTMINARAWGVFYNVVAADPLNSKYSAVGTTKYAITLAQPKLPYPMPVTSITATSGLNKITLNWSVPLDSTNDNTPATYNYISSILVYAIINTSETSGHYDHATDTSYDFGLGPDPSNNINTTTVYRLLTTPTPLASTVRSYNHTTLWDNEIVGYRVVTRNSQGLFSGQDPNNPTSGNILWGTTQTDISGSKYRESKESHPNLYTFANTHVQAKTSAPVKAGQVTMAGGVARNNVNASWTVPGTNVLPAASTYSRDTSLAYSVSYIYNSSFGSGDLTPSNSTLIAIPEEDATSTNASTSYNIPNLVPGSKYTISTIVYTNMQATHVADNLWTANEPGTNTVGSVSAVAASKEYNTSTNGITVSVYSLIAENTNNSVASGFPIPINVGHPVYQVEFDGNNLTWKHPQYQAYSWFQYGANIPPVLCPAHMVSYWRTLSVDPFEPTQFYLHTDGTALISNYTMATGDIIAVFDVTSNKCLDNYIWVEADIATNKVLTADKLNITGELGAGGFKFQLWKASTKTLHNICVTSYDTYLTSGSTTAGTTPLIKLSGAKDVFYKELKFAILPNKYRIYHNGVHKDTVTDVLAYDASSLADTEKNNYDVTWYSDIGVIISRSNVNSWNINGESPKWMSTSATGLLVEEPYVITIRNPTKTNVTYASDSTDLTLGDNGTQNFEFVSQIWYQVSFNVIDILKTTVRSLFGSITDLTTTDQILVYDSAYRPYKYGSTDGSIAWDHIDGAEDASINYSKGYLFKIITNDSQSRTLTVTGKKIRGINLVINGGWNFMGHPYSSVVLGDVLLFNTSITNSSVTIFSLLSVVYAPVGGSVVGPNYATIYGGPPRTSILYGDQAGGAGVMTFVPGSMYVINLIDTVTVLVGTLSAIRLKGDFTGDKNVTAADYIALANYLVQINPDYNNIAEYIRTEATSENYFAHIKSINSAVAGTVGLNDLVYLISYVNSNSSIGFPEENAK